MVITLCMGSSCFSRGNGENLEAVRAWLAEHQLEAEVELKGCRCGAKCHEGPNISIDGVWHSGMTAAQVPALLAEAFHLEA